MLVSNAEVVALYTEIHFFSLYKEKVFHWNQIKWFTLFYSSHYYFILYLFYSLTHNMLCVLLNENS